MNMKAPSVAVDARKYWAEVMPPDHLVQIYQEDEAFLTALEAYVAVGLAAGEGVVLIATPVHLDALEERLQQRGIDVHAAIHARNYFALDAEETLSHFYVDGQPDEEHFGLLLTEVLRQAGLGRRPVRAFGEMVGILCARGEEDTMLRLEHLWHRLCWERSFVLFCAYSRNVFTHDASRVIRAVCECHSRVVA
ncbi:MAG: hypothetical protein K0R03_249 [Moraxellaceae bacterium]|jgi:hypothetical protein|nr:hypothetical protein [Moraxellaceae bacterium]